MAFPMFMHSFLIEMTLPNSPSSPTQKYRLTAKGKDLLAKEGQGGYGMSAYPDGRARVTDECLQIHHMPCDVFENSMNQRQLIEEVATHDQ